jgi:hypothetical protein
MGNKLRQEVTVNSTNRPSSDAINILSIDNQNISRVNFNSKKDVMTVFPVEGKNCCDISPIFSLMSSTTINKVVHFNVYHIITPLSSLSSI